MNPESLYDDHIAAIKRGAIEIVSGVSPERLKLAVAMVQHGEFAQVLGDNAEFYPMEMLERVKVLPPLFTYHGSDDTAVSVEGTKAYVGKLQQVNPQAKVVLKLERGDHGNSQLKSDLKGRWLKERLSFIESD